MKRIELIAAVTGLALVIVAFNIDNIGSFALSNNITNGQAVSGEVTESHENDEKNDHIDSIDRNNQKKEYIEAIDLNSEYLMLVNKENTITKEYAPSELVLPDIAFIDYADPIVRVVEKNTAKALEEMFSAAKQEDIILMAVSGYRSYDIQVQLYQSNLKSMGVERAKRYSAQAGASEHQTGLAMDIVSSEFKRLNTDFEKTKAFSWLKENCYKYGFILRYPEGKEEITGYAYEPWHYRYVGLPHSKIITENNLTLEEYLKNYQYILEGKSYIYTDLIE